MARNNEATLTFCLKRSLMFKGLNSTKKMSSWRLLAKALVFFSLANFYLSLPNMFVLKRLCPSSSVTLEILCLLIYTVFATIVMFLVLFVMGFASTVVLFVSQRRYRFTEVTNTLVLSCSHVLLYPGSLLLALSIFGIVPSCNQTEQCPKIFTYVLILFYLSFSTFVTLSTMLLFVMALITDLVLYIQNLHLLEHNGQISPRAEGA